MMIHVPLSKNRQDRYTILSYRNLEILTEYWYRYNRPMGWLFPSTVRDKPLTNSAVELFVKKHAQKLGLPDGVTPHTMRHCFACHALEDGGSHTFIQQLLGHRSPNSTDVYLQMTSKALMGIQSPFDTFIKQDGGVIMMNDTPTMQDILRHFYPKYLDFYTLTGHQAKTVL